MKKRIVLLLSVGLMAAWLWGCGGQEAEEPQEPAAEETTEEEEAEEAKPAEEETEEAEEETTQEAAPAGDIKPVETTIDSPAKLGDWVETKRYSAEDSQYHTVYYRITDIVRGAQDEVDAYNASDSFVKLENLDNDELEYCMLTYEVYFPEDFPQADYGITSVDMDFGIENPDGGGIEKDGVAYIGLSSVWDISEAPEINEFYAGDTFTEGKAIFAMVKDVSGYVVESSYPDENDEMVYSYVEGK
ncbi:MAG TPA: hypothetical protein H9971_04665 [Candidatus Dorea merdavium]|nr:hypothetical protein [Candidatus Dorea merdavium]